MKTFFQILIFALLIVAFIFIFKAGSERDRIIQCRKLEKQAELYPGFFYADWQETMCEK